MSWGCLNVNSRCSEGVCTQLGLWSVSVRTFLKPILNPQYIPQTPLEWSDTLYPTLRLTVDTLQTSFRHPRPSKLLSTIKEQWLCQGPLWQNVRTFFKLTSNPLDTLQRPNCVQTPSEHLLLTFKHPQDPFQTP